MTSTWNIITQTTTTSWVSVTEGGNVWRDPRFRPLMTESRLNLRTESGGFIVASRISDPASGWVPL